MDDDNEIQNRILGLDIDEKILSKIINGESLIEIKKFILSKISYYESTAQYLINDNPKINKKIYEIKGQDRIKGRLLEKYSKLIEIFDTQIKMGKDRIIFKK